MRAASERGLFCPCLGPQPADSHSTLRPRPPLLLVRDVNNLILTFVMAEMLDINSQLSKWFQDRDLALAEVDLQLDYKLGELRRKFMKHTVGGVSKPAEFTPEIVNLFTSLSESGGELWGHTFKLSVRGDDGEELTWDRFKVELFRNKIFISRVCEKLISNIRERFPTDDVSMAAKFRVFCPDQLADPEGDDTHGAEEVLELAKHFSPVIAGKDEAVSVVATARREWAAILPFLRERARKATASGGKDVMMRRFYKLAAPTIAARAPLVWKLVMIMLVLQPATAEVERGFSALNAIKSIGRTQMHLGIVDALMRIDLCGPNIVLAHQGASSSPYAEFDAEVLPLSVEKWKAEVRNPSRSSHAARPNRVKHVKPRMAKVDDTEDYVWFE